MKIKCSKANLSAALNIVSKAVPTKSSLPILECILIDVFADKIKLTANDLELGIETILEGEVLEIGRIAVEAKIFIDIVRKLPDSDVYIESTPDMRTIIRCEKSKFVISSKSGEDFTELPDIEREKSITISQFTLKEIIRQTIFSIGSNENNKMMSGELFEVVDNKLTVVALDGHRIALRNVELKDQNASNIKVIVPGKTLTEIAKILNGGIDDMMNIYFTDNNILFEYDNTIVLSRLIEGEYFKIIQMLSIDHKTKINVNRQDLVSSVDRSTLLIKESDRKPIVMNIKDDTMYIKVDSLLGNLNEDIDVEKTGNDIIIGLNPRFMLDILRNIDDEQVTLYMSDGKAPCMIKNDNEDYIYIVLPININAEAYA